VDVRVTRSFCIRDIVESAGVNYENRTKNENPFGEIIERRERWDFDLFIDTSRY
jgi:hypothetical protein